MLNKFSAHNRFNHHHKFFSLFLGCIFTLAIFVSSRAAPESITIVSVATNGTIGNSASHAPDISADGRFVTFYSGASNLVTGDTNNAWDIFLHDTLLGTTTRVSVASDGSEANDHSDIAPAISADGRYVAFFSYASNLVSGDTNGRGDIFVHDTQTGATTRVSVSSNGAEANDQSNDDPVLSADGRYVAFFSYATNLVNGDGNSATDVFLHDRQTGVTTLVSIATDGTQGDNASYDPAISADGRFVAFATAASNLIENDTNGAYDVLVRDTQNNTTAHVSVASDGTKGNGGSFKPTLSADGRFVAFESESSNLVSGDTNGVYDIFLHDIQIGTTSRVSVATDGTEGNNNSFAPSISADGRYVVFSSSASNLVSDDTNGTAFDIFVHDTQTGITVRLSETEAGIVGNGSSFHPDISADGRFVAFSSLAFNFVNGDFNGTYDIFQVENSFTNSEIKVYLPVMVKNSP